MTIVKNTKKKEEVAELSSILDLIDFCTSEEDLTQWNGTLREYLPMVVEEPYLNELAHSRICRMIESAGVEFEDKDERKKMPFYNFFKKELFGVDHVLAQIMQYFKAAAAGSEVSRRILLLWGPTSSGKSQFSIMLKHGLEKFTRTKEGRVFGIDGCPMHENPLNAIPLAARKAIREKYGLVIEGDLCPKCAYRLKEEFGGDFWRIPVKRVFMSEMNRIGIGTFQPGDTKCTRNSLILLDNSLKDISELGNENEEDININVVLDNGKMARATKFFRYSDREILKIDTNLGYNIEATPNHPLMTVCDNGEFVWKNAEELAIGDTLVMSKGHGLDFKKEELMENKLNLKWTQSFARFLGLYISEGRFLKENVGVEISNCNENVKNMIKEFSIEAGLHMTYRKDGKGVFVWGEKLVNFMKELGFTTGAHLKHIPSACFTSGLIKDILFGMWLGDGNIGKHSVKDTNEAIYSTVSPILAHQTHLLLLFLGIPSNRIYDPSIGTSGAYKILITGERVEHLADILNIPKYKYTRDLSTVKHNENTYLMPRIDTLIRNVCKSINYMSDWHRYTVSTKSYGRRFSRNSLLKFAEQAEQNGCPKDILNVVKNIADKKYLYVQITSINKEIGDVYDIEVPEHHKFIANGFISHNSQSQSELVGSVNFAKLEDFGIESHPLAYNFDGELNVANRGLMEFIEMLKVDPKFRHILLTLAQEKRIKVERFPLIYADLVPIAHSVTGDTPIPYKKNEEICFSTMKDLIDKNDTKIQVLATDGKGNPVWTNVKSFSQHQFSGRLIKTIQSNGIVDTTWNHSIIGKDLKPFYPDSKQSALTFRTLPEKSEKIGSFSLPIPDSLHVVENKIFVKPSGNKKIDGEYGKYWLKSEYRTESKDLRDLLKVMAWFITEGHVNESHAIISQNNIDVLQDIKISAESISSSKGSLQNRSDKLDGTSRLHLSTRVWREILEYNCCKYSENKRIPDFIFNLSRQDIEYFFYEMVKGDGTVVPSNLAIKSQSYLDKCYRYKTTSKMLASQFGFLSTMLGMDFSISHSYTSTGKEAFEIRYRESTKKDQNNTIEEVLVEDITVYDIECEDNHSFTCGVGNVVCHNTNETEFNKFVANKTEEALHDRLWVVKFPYNLRLDDEVKIYEKLICQTSGFQGVHIAPHTLYIAAMFAILSRLEEPKDRSITLLQKMRLYNSENIEGLSPEDIKELQEDAQREGLDGISPRYIVNRLAACFARHGVRAVTPIAAIRSIQEGLSTNAKLDKEQIHKLEELISLCIEEYSKIATNEVQKAFFVNFEYEIKNLLSNYIDNVGAYLDDSKIENEWGDMVEADEKLMRSIEEKINITTSGKDEFRQEVYRKMIKSKSASGQYNYQSHPKLKEALQKQLFNERKDVIRLTVSARNPDPEGLKKINEVVNVLVEKHGYTAESANELLRYVSDIMSKNS
ncbi:MAG: LAGLIDADG family homing endonuclease [Patescibacteria group bacterium]